MVASPERALSLETDWLHGYARTYLPSEAALVFPPEELRRAGVSLIDLKHLFRTGIVTWSDKLDGPGAIWKVWGTDCEGRSLLAMIVVQTETLTVRLRSLERLESGKDEDHDDAA